MDLFIANAYPFAYNPCLYIVKQMFPGNNAHRCGSSGTKLFKDADTAYGSDSTAKSGLISRAGLYMGFWRPLKGTIYAALQTKRQLVSKIDSRVVEDYEGNTVSTNKGMSTLVRTREADFHRLLDAKGYRWDDTKKNELFVPKNGVEDLIKEMRKVDGLQMYLFNSTDYYEDPLYSRRSRINSANATPVIKTSQKQMQPRRADRSWRRWWEYGGKAGRGTVVSKGQLRDASKRHGGDKGTTQGAQACCKERENLSRLALTAAIEPRPHACAAVPPG